MLRKTIRICVISVIAAAVLALAAVLVMVYRSNKESAARQFYDYHKILRVSDEALFNARGEINQNVLSSLMAILNDKSLEPFLRPKTWPTGVPFTGKYYFETTAEDFSRYITGEPDPQFFYSDSGAILIKLFETVPNRRGVKNAHLTEFTRQWWQLVYRSTDSNHDVLTLWMSEPYRLSHFNGNRYDYHINSHDNCPRCADDDRTNERYILINKVRSTFWRCIPVQIKNTILSDEDIVSGGKPNNNYTFEGNYSQSIARANLLRDMNGVFRQFRGVQDFIVSPSQLPGLWQSSEFQTGTNGNYNYYISGQFQIEGKWDDGSGFPGTGIGAAGLIWGNHPQFSLYNGLDGLSAGPVNGGWLYSPVESCYNDLFWLPSDYEVRSMGHYHDNARFQTFARNGRDPTSRLWTNAYYPWRDEHGITSDPPECAETRPDYGRGRSGLWRLNGYDRAFLHSSVKTDRAWLRSADSTAMGDANTVYFSGNRYSHGVFYKEGLRPGLHLSITKLKEQYTGSD